MQFFKIQWYFASFYCIYYLSSSGKIIYRFLRIHLKSSLLAVRHMCMCTYIYTYLTKALGYEYFHKYVPATLCLYVCT